MVSQDQSKDSGSKKNGGKELGMVTPQDKPLKKMKFVSSAETEPSSTTTISEDSKSGRGMSTMPRVVKRKLQKIKPVVEYNKRGKGCGPAHTEMQSYIVVLARSRVPLVDKKWAEIPKDIKEQIWEAVDMAFVVGQGGKTSVLSSAAKKWKDFKSTLTRHYILPYIKEREKLSQPPEVYKFIEKAEWDAFVASRLSKEFESVHSQHSQIREKLEYNHRLSRKGYAGLEDQLEETMPGVEIDRSTLWKKARQDKHGNIPDPKVAEKAKLIDKLQKQVAEGSLSLTGSNDVLTLALGPKHPGRVRGVGAGISPRQFFNLPRPQRVKFADQLKESVRIVLQEETKKMEARTKQLVEAEREHLLSQLSHLIPNFDPSMLKPKTSPCQNQGLQQSPKNPMSDKASCSGAEVRSLHLEDDTAKNGEQQEETKKEENKDEEKMGEKKDEGKKEEKKEKKDEGKKEDTNDEEKKKEKQDEEKHDDEGNEVVDYSNVEVPSSLQSLCGYVETTLKPQGKIMTFNIEKEVFGADRGTFVLHEDITQFAGMEEIGATVVAVYMRCLYDLLREANMCSMVGFIDPAQVSANAGSLTDRSRIVASRLQKTDGEQIFMMPYNPGRLKQLTTSVVNYRRDKFIMTSMIKLLRRVKLYNTSPSLGLADCEGKEGNRLFSGNRVPLPGNRVVDEEGKNIVNNALKIYNSHIGRPGRKEPIWKTLPGTPKQPSSVECGYYVMRFMRDIIMDPSLEFEKKFAKGKDQAPYPQAAIDEVRKEWAEFVCLHMD
ncbi:unnamed protein product [Prunus armeniaca]